MNATTPQFTVHGSHGDATFDATTGALIEADECGCEDCAEQEHDGYAGIARLDLDEYRAWARREFPAWEADTDTDVLLVGYWLHDGTYEPADEEARAMSLAGARETPTTTETKP